MKHKQRTRAWLFLVILVCFSLLACQFLGQLGVPAFQEPTPTPSETPLPTPTDTPPPTDTNTPLPTTTDTPIPPPTKPPTQTAIPATDTPGVSIVTVVNNLNQPAKFILTGPETKGFTVNAHSKYTFEILPGIYKFQFTATNFVAQNGTVTFPPGPFTWTWGKAKP